MITSHGSPAIHICISEYAIISAYYGLSFVWCQTIIWTNANILLDPLDHMSFNFKITILQLENEFENIFCKMAAMLFLGPFYK